MIKGQISLPSSDAAIGKVVEIFEKCRTPPIVSYLIDPELAERGDS